jgi:hypothetical protein
MTRHYCCYFDHRYLPRGLAMIRSLRGFDTSSLVWVLCLDDECHQLLTRLNESGVRLIRMADFEVGDEPLAVARANRSLLEYYFTLTPSLLLYVLNRVSAEDTVTYVDGDLYFFSDPQALHTELGADSVSITGHRFPEQLKHLERYGLYNVGWLTFRNDARARAVAEWWRERCNEWCYDTLEDDRFADQKYLDRFQSLFAGVRVLQHPGANVAPWNVHQYAIRKAGEIVTVDGRTPLVFFHFHGLKRWAGCAYLAIHHRYSAPFGGAIRRDVYRPYVRHLAAITAEVEALGGVGGGAALARNWSGRRPLFRRVLSSLKRGVSSVPGIARGQVLLAVGRRCL